MAKPARYKVAPDLYVIDSSGSGDPAIKGQVDALFKRVQDSFQPDKVRVLKPKRSEAK